MTLWLVLLLQFWISPRFGWIDAGHERGQRIAVNIDSVPRDVSRVFATSYVAVPQQPHGRSRHYAIWIADWDCAERTRHRLWRIEYSPHHDPRRSRLDERTENATDNPAIGRQLDILCNLQGLHSSDVTSIIAFVAAD